MLQILLLILKILGIAVLVILGIVLAVLLLVLLVPVRYRGDVAFDGKPKGSVLVSWLLHLVTVRVNYDGSVTALVKVLWFKLFDKTVWPAEETEPDLAEGTDDTLDWMVTESGTESGGVSEPIPAPAANGASEAVSVPVSESTSAPANPLDQSPESVISEVPQKKSISLDLRKVKPDSDFTKSDFDLELERMMERGSDERYVLDSELDPETIVNTEPKRNPSTDASSDCSQESVKEPVIEKIVNAIRKLIEKITCTYQQICGKVETGQEKIAQVRTFLADEANKKTIRLIKRQIFKLIKHILPRKLTGRVKFGFDDPATTGQILMYVSPFYGAYAKSLKLEPVFDEKIMEGELHLKGHIRLGSMLWIAVRVVLDKNFRRLLKLLLAKGKKKEETV